MKKTLLTAVLVGLMTIPALAGVKKLGNINGIDIYRVRTASVFAPSATLLVAADPNQPGTLSVIGGGTGPGIVPAAANAGGLVGAAALLRPARSETNVNASGGSSGSSSAATGSGTATGGSQHVPPGHINNPSGNH